MFQKLHQSQSSYGSSNSDREIRCFKLHLVILLETPFYFKMKWNILISVQSGFSCALKVNTLFERRIFFTCPHQYTSMFKTMLFKIRFTIFKTRLLNCSTDLQVGFCRSWQKTLFENNGMTFKITMKHCSGRSDETCVGHSTVNNWMEFIIKLLKVNVIAAPTVVPFAATCKAEHKQLL